MWPVPVSVVYPRAIYIFVYGKCHTLDFNENLLQTECQDFARKCCSTINTPFTQRADF